MDSHYLDQFIGQVSEHIQVHFPEDCGQMSDDRREVLIRDGIRAGQTYGLTTDRNLTLFIDFRLTFGVDFPAHQGWATAILNDGDLTEDEKTERLLAGLEESDE